VSTIKLDFFKEGIVTSWNTAIFYIGPNVSKFVDVFRLLGRVILPEDQKYG
jgi:hypothetical protein